MPENCPLCHQALDIPPDNTVEIEVVRVGDGTAAMISRRDDAERLMVLQVCASS